jgi:hypothetical protein
MKLSTANCRTSFTLQNSSTIDLPQPIAVVCHDAGATNLIVSWLRGWTGAVRHCLGGPAVGLWQKENPSIKNRPLVNALQGAAILLSGTGWASDLEHQARKLAQSMGIRSIGVIDHWVNYRERFIRNGELILPNEIWVADAYAKAEAQRCFPDVSVYEHPNLYLQSMVEEVAAFLPQAPSETPHKVLYVLEPIRSQWGSDVRPGELQAFEYFLDYLDCVGDKCAIRIVLRPHPSDPAGKYDEWLTRFAELDLSLDGATSLAAQIAWADWVVGCDSFALVVAMHAGRITFSAMPHWAPPSSLPQQDLRHIRQLIGRSS